MKIFVRNCQKLSAFWIISFISLLSVYLSNSLNQENSIGLKVLYWLVISFTFIFDFAGTYDTFKKSFKKKNDFDRMKLKGFVKTLRILLIFNLILMITIISIFGGNNNKSEWGYIFASVSIFCLFLMVKTFFIFGSFKLGKIIKELNQQDKHMNITGSEIVVQDINAIPDNN